MTGSLETFFLVVKLYHICRTKAILPELRSFECGFIYETPSSILVKNIVNLATYDEVSTKLFCGYFAVAVVFVVVVD